MIFRLVVPGPIEDVREIRVLEWHRGPDEPFTAGELIVELETSKAVVEVRAGQAGIIRRIFCQDGEWQNIGGVLALVSDAANEPLAESAEVPGGAAPMLADFEVV